MLKIFVLLVNLSFCHDLSAVSELARRPYLGLILKDADQKIPCLHTQGASEDGSAAKFKIIAGDCILAIDHHKVDSVKSFLDYMATKKTGEKVLIEFGGKNNRYSFSIPLIGRPVESETNIKFNYSSLEVNLRKLRIIESTPLNIKNHANTILYLQGASCTTVEIPKSNAVSGFKELIYGLTKAGHRVIRYDRSGTGDSEGDCSKLSYSQELAEAKAILKHVKSQNGISKKNIYLLGLSNGAPVALELASQSTVRGIILYGMAVKPFFEYAIENTRWQENLAQVKGSEINVLMNKVGIFWSQLLLQKKSFKEIKKELPQEFRVFEQNYDKNKDTLYTRSAQYFQELHERNLLKIFEEFKINALLMWGTSDFVSRRNDHILGAEAMKNGLGKFVAIKNADHFLNEADSEKDSLDNIIVSRWNPEILRVMNDWINSK